MKKIIFLMFFGFFTVSAQGSDIDIPMFGDGKMPTEEQKKENADFPLFLPPTAPQSTAKELPFREPLETKKSVDLSVPEVPVQAPEEKTKQKFLPALPKDKDFKIPTSIPPRMKTTIEIKPEGIKASDLKKETPKTEPKEPANPARASSFQFGTTETSVAPSSDKIRSDKKAPTPSKITTPPPPPKEAVKDISKTTIPAKVVEPVKPQPSKPISQQPTSTRPTLLQKSMALPVAQEQEAFLNPFDVKEASPESNSELPPEILSHEKKASPVEDMDIMGIYLHMSPQDITDEAQLHGFRVAHIAHAIPTFATTRLEKDCRREEGLLQLEIIRNCVRERAQKEGIYYISALTFKNEDTKEKLVAKFTSHFTDNKAYYVEYTSLGDNSLGTSIKDIAKKTTRRDLFWDLVFEKYGTPTYPEQLVWGDPREMYFKAYMEGTALNGKLVMEDKVLPQDDVSEAYINLPPPPEVNFFSFTD